MHMLKRLYMEMSLNGFIAHSDDSVSWSNAAWESYLAACREFGCLIIGRRSFETIPEEELESIKRLCLVVVSNTLNSAAVPPWVSNVSRTPREALTFLESRGFSRVLIGGGTTLNTAFMAGGLVDEITIDLEPVVYAEGKPLFAGLPRDCSLSLIEARRIGEGSLQISYKVLRP